MPITNRSRVLGSALVILVLAAFSCWAMFFSDVGAEPLSSKLVGESLAQSGVTGKPRVELSVDRVGVGNDSHVVVVVDQNGDPIPGARCRASSVVAGGARWLLRNDYSDLGVTGKDGILEYDWQALGAYQISASAAGHETAACVLDKESLITLARGCDIVVRCITEGGDPLPGVRVALSLGVIPSLSSIPPEAAASLHDDAIHVQVSNELGIAQFRGLRTARYWLRASIDGYLSRADDATLTVEVGTEHVVQIEFSTMWFAGVQFVGSGRLISQFSATKGSGGTGRHSPRGRAMYRKMRRKFPEAVLASALWGVHARQRMTVLAAWHTTVGWFADEVPFQHATRFRPVMVSADTRQAVEPASVRIVFEGPDGGELSLEGCSLRGGARYGLPFAESDLANVRPALRSYCNIYMKIEEHELTLPPGRYRVLCGNHAVQFKGSPIIDVAAGAVRTVRIPLKRAVGHLRFDLQTSGELEWEQALVRIYESGKLLHQQTIYRDPDRNVLAPPAAPVGVELELEIQAVGFQKHNQSLTLLREGAVIQASLRPSYP
jgi:hypothetical protein